jgi:arylsulfatase A-like enzyme
VNILLVTVDQFRGDALSCSGHPVVGTPHLDALAADGVRFDRHHSQCAPCAPGRASLYTGTYQMNHRVVGNGTPLDDRFDNVARLARRAGLVPTLFGYTDQAIDPRTAIGPDDRRLFTYEGVLPGFEVALDLSRDHRPWLVHLERRGHSTAAGTIRMLATEHERHEDDSVSAFLTDRFVEWLDRREGPWFAHLSYLRPHPPYSAAGRYSTMYRPDEVGEALSPSAERHRLHEALLVNPQTAAPSGPGELGRLRAQYFGMISEVDAQIGRVREALRDRGMTDDTAVIVTADHGEMLGDHGLLEKVGYWEESYRVPCIVSVPGSPVRGHVVSDFTENVDILPTIAELLGLEPPAQCDGLSLGHHLAGRTPPWWRRATTWEYDWRHLHIGPDGDGWPWDRRGARSALAVRMSDTHGYVQFADGDWLCFDLVMDPTWRTVTTDEVAVGACARDMLGWRMEHAPRDLAGLVLGPEPLGRWPDGMAWRG